jgi:hypothetical protein
LIVFFIGLAIYFVPTIVARTRGHRNAMAIGVLNLLLGWMLVPWVIALVWACLADQARAEVLDAQQPRAPRVPPPSRSAEQLAREAASIRRENHRCCARRDPAAGRRHHHLVAAHSNGGTD